MPYPNKPFKKVAAGSDRPSASEHNKITRVLGNIGRSLFSSGYIDSTGFLIRPTPLEHPATVRRARTTEAAGADRKIKANLYGITDGLEQETGIESDVDVWCTITGGANLNAAIPLLEDNMDIFVIWLPETWHGEVIYYWWCVQIFQKMDICPLDT